MTDALSIIAGLPPEFARRYFDVPPEARGITLASGLVRVLGLDEFARRAGELGGQTRADYAAIEAVLRAKLGAT